jgi:putative acetyltransferase
MSEIVVRHVTPEDAAALHRIYGQPDTQASTLHLPHSSLQMWHTRLATSQPHAHLLVACIDDVVVGQCALHVEERARRRHVASLGMGVDNAIVSVASEPHSCVKWSRCATTGYR